MSQASGPCVVCGRKAKTAYPTLLRAMKVYGRGWFAHGVCLVRLQALAVEKHLPKKGV